MEEIKSIAYKKTAVEKGYTDKSLHIDLDSTTININAKEPS